MRTSTQPSLIVPPHAHVPYSLTVDRIVPAVLPRTQANDIASCSIRPQRTSAPLCRDPACRPGLGMTKNRQDGVQPGELTGTGEGCAAVIEELARERLGFEQLRPGQLRAVEALVDGRDVLAVLPTGGG